MCGMRKRSLVEEPAVRKVSWVLRIADVQGPSSPNQVLTHAARVAAKQLNKVSFQALLVAARGAREGLWYG